MWRTCWALGKYYNDSDNLKETYYIVYRNLVVRDLIQPRKPVKRQDGCQERLARDVGRLLNSPQRFQLATNPVRPPQAVNKTVQGTARDVERRSSGRDNTYNKAAVYEARQRGKAQPWTIKYRDNGRAVKLRVYQIVERASKVYISLLNRKYVPEGKEQVEGKGILVDQSRWDGYGS